MKQGFTFLRSKKANAALKYDNAAFTLVELIIALGATVIVATLIVSLLINQSGVFFKQNAIVNVGINLNDSVSKINSYIMQSSAIAGGYPEASPQYITGQDVLVLKLMSINTDGPISDAYDYIVISKDSSENNILRVRVFPDPQSTREMSDSVATTLLDSIQFKYLDNAGNNVTPTSATSIELSLTVAYLTGGSKSQRTSQTVTSLRNML